MRTTLNLDDEVVRRAFELTGRTEKATLVRLGLGADHAGEFPSPGCSRRQRLGGLVTSASSTFGMILVDTSIWIDHLHRSDAVLSGLLSEAQVCTHPMIVGELALRSLRDRTTIPGLLSDLPRTALAAHAEVIRFVQLHALSGIGLSLVDAHLLAALHLSPPVRLWRRDRRLRLAADKLGVPADLPT